MRGRESLEGSHLDNFQHWWVVGRHHSLGVGHAENLVTWGEYDLPHYDEFEVPRDILESVCVARQ